MRLGPALLVALVALSVSACASSSGDGGGGQGGATSSGGAAPTGGGGSGAAGTGGEATGGLGGAGGSDVTKIRVHYDTGLGNDIWLRGDSAGLSWTVGQPCAWSAGNVWVCDVSGATSAVTMKPLVNDADWAMGWNWRVAAGGAIDIYPHFYDTTGRFVTHASFVSGFLASPRDVTVYLPPGYDENPLASYPVLLMHDGQNLFDPAAAFGGVAWEIDAAVDDLATFGGIEEMIVVGVDNNADRIYEYTPTFDASVGDGGGADDYLSFLAEELRPFIDLTYRTRGAKSGIAGSSLGGLLSLWGCWQRPADFDHCGVFSPSIWWDNGLLLAHIGSDPATAADKPLRIYLDSGDSGPSNDGMTNTAAMRDLLVQKGFVLGDDLDYVLGVGMSHNETAWAARAPGALAWLYADPARVEP